MPELIISGPLESNELSNSKFYIIVIFAMICFFIYWYQTRLDNSTDNIDNNDSSNTIDRLHDCRHCKHCKHCDRHKSKHNRDDEIAGRKSTKHVSSTRQPKRVKTSKTEHRSKKQSKKTSTKRLTERLTERLPKRSIMKKKKSVDITNTAEENESENNDREVNNNDMDSDISLESLNTSDKEHAYPKQKHSEPPEQITDNDNEDNEDNEDNKGNEGNEDADDDSDNSDNSNESDDSNNNKNNNDADNDDASIDM